MSNPFKIKSFSFETKGLLLSALASLCYASMATCIKFSQNVETETLVFFRNLIGFLFFIPFFAKTKFSLKTSSPVLMGIRAILGVTSFYCFVYATKHLPLVESVLLINTAPLFVPLILLLLFQQKMPVGRSMMNILGFIGVIVILKPQNGLLFNVHSVIGLASGLAMAGVGVSLRLLSKTETAEKMLFYFFISILFISFFPMIFSFHAFDNTFWIDIFLMGFFFFIYQYSVTKAYSYAPATKVSMISYLATVFSGFFDWIFWNHLPDMSTLIGVSLVIGTSCYILFEEKMKGSSRRE